MNSVPPPVGGINLPDTFKSLPAIDTEGGEIIEIKQHEEIDPIDNCKVFVFTYKILSADKTEEITKTTRRKLKLECTVHHETITQNATGENANRQLRTSRYTGDIDGLQPQLCLDNGALEPIILQQNGGDQQENNAIRNAMQERFGQIFNEQKSEFINMFPELFNDMRTEPSLFALPSTQSETITNPDGSITTRMQSSRAFSSHYSKQETYINGVKQDSKVKTRAFVEYFGPEGGFRVKLADNDNDAEQSEDEDEDDRKSVAPSELPDNVSAMVFTQPSGVPRLDLSGKTKKRIEKAWLAAQELVETEQRYVDKLRLLDELFRERLERENVLSRDSSARLFANTSSLYRFHSDHLLPQLMDRSREWQETHKISDVMRKQAPYLKMYSEYTNNYKNATREFESLLKKNKRFAAIVQEIQQLPECGNMSLLSHLICPIQRVMRYQLLLQEYIKHLDEDDPDYEDTKIALNLVLEAAGHANEMMRKLDRYRNVLEVQEMLNNAVQLVSPSRELVKQGALMKISSKTNRAEERQLFLFNDVLLLCSQRNMIGFGNVRYKLRAVFAAAFMQVCEGDNLEREYSFYVRGSDSESGPSRCIELFANTSSQKKAWFDSLWNVISEESANNNSPKSDNSQLSIRPNVFTPSPPSGSVCSQCSSHFNWRSKPTKCDDCLRTVCKKCCRKLKNPSDRILRLCEQCWNDRAAKSQTLKNPSSVSIQKMTDSDTKKRHNMLMVSCNGESILYSGWVILRTSTAKQGTRRFFAIRKDFCLYSFKSDTDKCALTMLPLPGCEVKVDNEKLCFRIKHLNRQYIIEVSDEVVQAKWMAVLELASNAALPQR